LTLDKYHTDKVDFATVEQFRILANKMDNLAEADAVAKDIKYLRDTTASIQRNIENNLATNDELFSS
jgi:hypothetical protein